LILQYIVPGYLVLKLTQFTLSKKINAKNELIISCVISYVFLSIISLFRIKWFKRVPDTAIINSALSIFIGIILVVLIVIVSQRKWFKRIIVKLFHKTLSDDIWGDVLDLENGSNLKVYFKDKDYYLIGQHKNHEKKGNDSWMALKGFAKFDKKTNQNYKDEPSYLGNPNIFVTFRLSDVEHIEIF
jgi:hypothetical protein